MSLAALAMREGAEGEARSAWWKEKWVSWRLEGAGERSTPRTLQLAEMKAMAVSSPIPLDMPVIIATWQERCRISIQHKEEYTPPFLGGQSYSR